MEEKDQDLARQRFCRCAGRFCRAFGAFAASRELGTDGVPDIGDMSSQTYSRDVLLNLNETQRRKILDIDAALERLAKGEYGICVRCEEEIPPRRMEVRPFSRYCVECKAEVEKFGE